MAASLPISRRGEFVVSRRVFWPLAHLFSFETVFLLFLYSNEIKMLLPWLPIDETLLFGGLSVLVGVYVIFKEGIYIRGVTVVAAAVLFAVWALITTSWTPSQMFYQRSVSYLFTFNMWSLVAGAIIIANRRERLMRFFCLLLILALILSAIGLQIYWTYGSFRRLGLFGDEIRRVYLAWGYTVADGAAVALAIVIFCRLLSLKQLFFGVLFVICLFFLLIGGARGPLVGVTAAMMLAILAQPLEISHRRFAFSTAQITGFALFFAAAVYISYLLATGQATNSLDRFITLFDTIEDPSQIRGANRLIYWPAAVRLWMQEPVFGHGIASFSILHSNVETQGTHPHNLILEVLAEQGLIGLVLFLFMFWSGLRHARLQRLQRDPLMLCALMIFATGIMAAMFGKDLAGAKKSFFVLGLLALRPPPPPPHANLTAAGGSRAIG